MGKRIILHVILIVLLQRWGHENGTHMSNIRFVTCAFTGKGFDRPSLPLFPPADHQLGTTWVAIRRHLPHQRTHLAERGQIELCPPYLNRPQTLTRRRYESAVLRVLKGVVKRFWRPELRNASRTCLPISMVTARHTDTSLIGGAG